jgi:hypothetical protein
MKSFIAFAALFYGGLGFLIIHGLNRPTLIILGVFALISMVSTVVIGISILKASQ